MILFSILTFIGAALTVFFDHTDKRFVYVFKPATMLLIMALAWVFTPEKNFFFWAIFGGFVFSLIGDTLLINPANFVFGLVAFLIAHLFYIVAFGASAGGKFSIFSLLSYGVIAVMLPLLYQGIPVNLRIPVVIYMFIIATMLAAAFNFGSALGGAKAIFAVSGAVLFTVSDSFLAFRKFRGDFFSAAALILFTYFAAQWLIARSAIGE